MVGAGHAAGPRCADHRLRPAVRDLQARRPVVPRFRPAAPTAGESLAAGADRLRRQGAPRGPAGQGGSAAGVPVHPGSPVRGPGSIHRRLRDAHLAHVLVQGVDLWLNLPRVPLEASGTSGMKAALNGGPASSAPSTAGGQEGYDGTNGWAIPRRRRRRRTPTPPTPSACTACWRNRSCRSTTTGTPGAFRWAGSTGCGTPCGSRAAVHRAADGAGIRRALLRARDPGEQPARRQPRGTCAAPAGAIGRLPNAAGTDRLDSLGPSSPAGPVPPETRSPVGVVHLAAEYDRLARTGGLAEAVAGLASIPGGAGRFRWR